MNKFVATLVLAAGVPLGASTATATATGALAATVGLHTGTLDSFYALPAAPSPAPTHGSLIRFMAAGTNTFRIMYWTEQTTNRGGTKTTRAVPATATVSRPRAARPPGGYPVVGWEHGTVGLIAKCAPSRNPASAFYKSWLRPDTAWSVAPDHVGLGADPGLRSAEADHVITGVLGDTRPFDKTSRPYLSREGGGRDALDAIRATKQLDALLSPGRDIGPNRSAILIGLSEGAHAAVAAAEVHATNYAPDVNLRAVVAASAPSDILVPGYDEALLKNLAPRVVVGLSVENQDVRPSTYLSQDGKWSYGETYDSVCSDNPYYFAAPYFTGNPLVAGASYTDLNDPARQPAIAAAIERVKLGMTTVKVPLLVGQSDGDQVVLPANTKRFVDRARSRGYDLTYCTYPANWLLPELDHNAALTKLWEGSDGTCTKADGTRRPTIDISQWLGEKGVDFLPKT